MWKRRLRRTGWRCSLLKTRKDFVDFTLDLQPCVCMCDVRVENFLVYRKIKVKCLLGVEGVMGKATL